jgi:CheY-like chemotaxis protein
MSGLLLANRLKTSKATEDIVLIAMTDLGGAATERLARTAGFAAYVRKPLDPSLLCGIVQAAAGLGGSP